MTIVLLILTCKTILYFPVQRDIHRKNMAKDAASQFSTMVNELFWYANMKDRHCFETSTMNESNAKTIKEFIVIKWIEKRQNHWLKNRFYSLDCTLLMCFDEVLVGNVAIIYPRENVSISIDSEIFVRVTFRWVMFYSFTKRTPGNLNKSARLKSVLFIKIDSKNQVKMSDLSTVEKWSIPAIDVE